MASLGSDRLWPPRLRSLTVTILYTHKHTQDVVKDYTIVACCSTWMVTVARLVNHLGMLTATQVNLAWPSLQGSDYQRKLGRIKIHRAMN